MDPTASCLLAGSLYGCLEDGTVLDFFGSNLVNVGEFGYGAIARYLPPDRNEVLFFLFYFTGKRVFARLFFDLSCRFFFILVNKINKYSKPVISLLTFA
jgi:hypothetical protein